MKSTACLMLCAIAASASAQTWTRHVIDGSSRGADGIRLADVNGDGLADMVTGWEEGGEIHVCINPGAAKAREAWPRVTVGKVVRPEDAVFVDLDGDGAIDVVSCTERGAERVNIHWAPKSRDDLTNANAWMTTPIDATVSKSLWMFCEPMQIDGERGVDLIVGSKGHDAMVAWLESPDDPRDAGAWKLHKLADAGWIMSLVAIDMDSDGDTDVLLSDRRGNGRGIKWLENPGAKATRDGAEWKVHHIAGEGREVMFLSVADIDRDGLDDIVCAVKPNEVLAIRRLDASGTRWKTHTIAMPPPDRAGHAKGIAGADVNGDGRTDLLLTCEGATGDRSGVWWIDVDCFADHPEPTYHDIAGPEGVKFDLIQMLDLDGDGDLDLATCEEITNLGVIWYENPAEAPTRP